jgi:hypothetical protein
VELIRAAIHAIHEAHHLNVKPVSAKK